MSLRNRILVILFIIFCVYAGLEYTAYQWLVYPVFVQQEQQQAQAATDNILKVARGQFSDVQKQVAFEARSGALYSALKNNAADFDRRNGNLDFALLYDFQWNRIQEQTPGQITSDRIEQALLEGQTPFLDKNQISFSKCGLVNVGNQYAFVVAEPILSSPNSTAVEGIVLAGQILSDEWLQDFRRRHHLNFNWNLLATEEQRDRNAEIVHQITPDNPWHVTSANDKIMECATVLFDRQDNPAILIKTVHDRTMTAGSKSTMDKIMLVKLSVGFVTILFLTGLLHISIVLPIRKLIRHVAKFGHPGSAVQNIRLSRKDEIGKLATEFDHMSRRLQNAQIKLMEKSYVSGATEMSSGILHNVRNALSPITTQIERIKDQFQEFPLSNLEQARAELQAGSLSQQRREDLMRFVELTFQHVLTNLKDMVAELEGLSTQVIQIESMLNGQKTFGGRKDLHVEFIEPIQLLNNALEIIPEKCRDKNRIHIGHGIKKLPSVPVHPTTFIQILQNLLINASESLEREKPLCPKIAVACEIETHEAIDMLHWTIQDNGIGIEADKLETIFERGASSKTQGLTGIGLHWCANTINAMQGRLWVESNGLHCGACFHLLIPMAAEECLAGSKDEQLEG